MSVHIVLNPVGASGRAKKTWKKIQPRFDQAPFPYVLHESTKEKGIEEIVKEITSLGEEIDLIVIGGDGSFNEAVNGIQDFSKTRFGMIPCGSGNDLAKDIGLSKNIDEVVDTLLQFEVKRVADVGEIVLHNHMYIIDPFTHYMDDSVYTDEKIRRFNISAGFGFDAEICAYVLVSKTKQLLNRVHLGKLCYLVEGTRAIFSTKLVPVEMNIDGEEVKIDQCLFVAAMNHAYEGGGFRFGPTAKYDDGQLELCIANGLSRFDFFRIFPYAYRGNHVKFDGVSIRKGKEIRLKSREPLWIHTDGEVFCKTTDVTIRLNPHKLQMLG